jgi:flagellar biogenesis protein FliO
VREDDLAEHDGRPVEDTREQIMYIGGGLLVVILIVVIVVFLMRR